jgi:hypothetical protein
MNRICLGKDSDQCRAFVNTVMILQEAAVSGANDWLFAPQEGLGYTQVF